MAAFGNPNGVFGAAFYSLSAGPRRRVLRRELRQAQAQLEEAKQEVLDSYLDYGKGVHAATAQGGLPSLGTLVGVVDYAVLRQAQLRADPKKKREAKLQDERVDGAFRKMADAAIELNLTQADPEGLRRFQAAEHSVETLREEIKLRKMGIEMYDGMAVFRGWIFLLIPVVVVVAAALSAYAAGRLPFVE